MLEKLFVLPVAAGERASGFALPEILCETPLSTEAS
jgi:hypothetical protein